MAKSVQLFPPTSLTLIEKVQSPDPQQREVAMKRFCRVYHPAIYALARKMGYTMEDAQDLTQDLFLKFIRSDALQKFDRKRGTKFSAWLITLFKNLTAQHHQSQATIKRGGTHVHVDFNTHSAELSYQHLHQAGMEPALMFDLMLAREIWTHAVERIRHKHAETPYVTLVRELEPMILLSTWPPPPAVTQGEFALRHGISAPQLRTFLHRTLRNQSSRLFAEEAMAASPGITPDDITQLWDLLRQNASA